MNLVSDLKKKYPHLSEKCRMQSWNMQCYYFEIKQVEAATIFMFQTNQCLDLRFQKVRLRLFFSAVFFSNTNANKQSLKILRSQNEKYKRNQSSVKHGSK